MPSHEWATSLSSHFELSAPGAQDAVYTVGRSVPSAGRSELESPLKKLGRHTVDHDGVEVRAPNKPVQGEADFLPVLGIQFRNGPASPDQTALRMDGEPGGYLRVLPVL